MKFKHTTGAGVFGLLLLGPVLGQDRDVIREQEMTRTAQETDKAWMRARKASEILGLEVRNARDDDLGDIKDLAIDPRSGDIAFGVVSFGGFLGIGDELYAVPWKAFSMATVEGDKLQMRLDVDEDRLEQAPELTDENWHQLSQTDTKNRLCEFYGVDPRGMEREKQIPAQHQTGQSAPRLLKASAVMDMDIVDNEGEEIDNIEELVLDPQRGSVAYVVLPFEGQSVAMPWQGIEVRQEMEDGEPELRLTVPSSKLAQAPRFDEDDLRRMTDPIWIREVFVFYGFTPFDREATEAGYEREREDRQRDVRDPDDDDMRDKDDGGR